MSPSTPLKGLEEINLVSDQMNLDRASEKCSHNDIKPRTNWTSQPPTFMRDEKTYFKLYPVKREASDMDGNFGETDHISEQLVNKPC